MHAAYLFPFFINFVLFSFLLKRNFKAKEPEKIVRVSVNLMVLCYC